MLSFNNWEKDNMEGWPNLRKNATMQDQTIVREITIVINVSLIQICVELWTNSLIEFRAYVKSLVEEGGRNEGMQENNYLIVKRVELWTVVAEE